MSDLSLTLEGVEAEVTSAALAHYAGFLAECAALGGDAAAVDEAIRPIVTRLSLRLADAMYSDDRSTPSVDGLDVERLAEALQRADGVQGFGGPAMARSWAEHIAREYATLAATPTPAPAPHDPECDCHYINREAEKRDLALGDHHVGVGQ